MLDLIGQRFSKWTVLDRCQSKRSHWRCQCECGNIRSVAQRYLIHSKSTQCNDCARGYNDLVGRVFDKWMVIARLPNANVIHGRIWVCRCKCGAENTLNTHRLTSGLSKGCRRCAVKLGVRIRPYEAIFNKVRLSAIREAKTFALTYEEFLRFTAIHRCHYCHANIRWVRHGHSKNGQPSNLDRKDNLFGYIPGNITVCCERCNRAKGNRFSYKEWFGMTSYLRDRNKGKGRKSNLSKSEALSLFEDMDFDTKN